MPNSNKYMRAYNKKHADKRKQAQARYYQKNKQKLKDQRARYRILNRAEINLNQRECRRNH